MFSFAREKRTDYLQFLIIASITGIGILVLSSLRFEPLWQYIIYALIGFLVYYFVSNIDFEVFKSWSLIFFVISIILLLVNFALGNLSRGVVRWINFGFGTFQPSEIVRPFLLIFFASELSKYRGGFVEILIIFLKMIIPLVLILIQPSLGMTLLITVAFSSMLIFSEINIKIKFIVLLIPLILFLISPFLINYLAPYQQARINSFLNPASDPLGAGYNSIQAKIAVGSGKFFGKGLGRGVQTQLSFLPEKHNDFIFASIAEEFGFFGSVVVLILYFLLLLKLSHGFDNIPSETGRLFVVGFVVMTAFQIFVNIGMNIGIMPITGIPLPLVSAGGSSLISFMIGFGIIASIKGL